MRIKNCQFLNFIIIIIINGLNMKGLLGSRSQNSLNKSAKLQKSIDKQNLPQNTKSKRKETVQTPGKKIGLQIRSRIQQSQVERQPLGSLKESQLINEPFPSLRQSQSIFSTDSKRMKSVSFDEKQKGPFLRKESQSGKKSILKNSLSKSKCSTLQKSQVSMSNSHVQFQDQSIQNNTNNKTIVQRYETILAETKKNGKKFKDDIYPPLQNSIYLNNSLMKNFCEMFQKEGRSIQWMRLSELYKNREMVLWTSDQSKKNIISKGHISKTGGDSDFLAEVFNTLSMKNSFLQKVFQTQTISKECIYRVKIHQTQTNIWKYIIVDDFIPVIINEKLPRSQKYRPQNVRPAFLDVSGSGKVELWPFLLQKAFAKYYSTYDSLANGNTLDFLEEITGNFFQKMSVNGNLTQINQLIDNNDVMLMAVDHKGVIHPLKNTSNESNQTIYTYLNRDVNYTEESLSSSQFLNTFSLVHFNHLHKYFHTSRCQIQQQNIKTVKQRVKKTKDPYILRQFVVEQNCECQIATVQKEQKFFRSYLTYQYAWIRMILVQKEARSYRWIDGSYSNNKINKVSVSLTPGQYIVIMMPQWSQKPYNFNLIFKGTVQTVFERKPYELYASILQESCMDLAQRCGKLVQVNNNICSYHYIQKNLGIIIQNINNQKEKSWVRVLRSVDGLQNYNIKPFNQQFKNRLSAQIVIPNRHHFTVVLLTVRGVQKSILDMFDFGSER